MEKKDTIIKINKRMMIGIAPAVAIIGVLLSKGDVGPLFLFLIGIVVGVIIGKNLEGR